MTIGFDVSETVRQALAEDIGSGDITARLIDEQRISRAYIICRQAAVICGAPWVDEVFRQLDERVALSWQVKDGDAVNPDQWVCELKGPARALLAGERTALNFLQTLSGTATRAQRYAQAVAGTGARVLDTRKTIPGLRQAQKYAVRCGGCFNHRMGLYDGILIKENHIEAAGSLENAIAQALRADGNLLVEIEVETLEQAAQALNAGAKRLLLDNMSIAQLREAVTLTQGRAQLEASGGVTLENIREIAHTGVDFISVGDLTKDLEAVDLSMRFEH
ncbi:MAG: carboxylating nicotinate-nucleotide diphosphorylase [Gammaproteobacteria bacterium]|jgi:nicotinate-nucleotide pyrophosphorylase (carboxylating)